MVFKLCAGIPSHYTIIFGRSSMLYIFRWMLLLWHDLVKRSPSLDSAEPLINL